MDIYIYISTDESIFILASWGPFTNLHTKYIIYSKFCIFSPYAVLQISQPTAELIVMIICTKVLGVGEGLYMLYVWIYIYFFQYHWSSFIVFSGDCGKKMH